MQKAYSRINWENYPSTETPLNETNLNRIDLALDTVDDRVVTFDLTKANQTDLLTCVDGITFNTSSGILTISFKNGTTATIDTGLAKLAVNFDYDDDPTSPHYQQLILEMKDGTYKYIDLSSMITQFEFDNTSTVVFNVNAQTGHISAVVPDGSITAQKLNPNVIVTMQAIEDAAEADALKSEGLAVGEQNGVPVGPGSPYYENNAKYYCEQAQGGGSGGHVIKDDTQTFVQRTGLKFSGKVAVTDDAVGGNTVVTVEAGGAVPHLIVLSEAGSTVRAIKGTKIIDADETSPEHFECDLEMDDPQDIYGVWTIHAVLDGDDAMMSLNVDTIKVYVVDDSHMHADITVTYPNGATVSCSMTGAPTQYATESPYTFVVHSYGVWRITGTRGGVTEIHDVTIYENGQEEEVTLSLIPDGSTVTPTDDIQLWLACAGIEDKPYTMLQQVLADSATLLKVLTNDNASDYLARSTTWATGITADSNAMAIIGSDDYCTNALLDSGSTWTTAIVSSTYANSVENISTPTMTSDNTPSGQCSAKTTYSSTYSAWKAFDKDATTMWASVVNSTDDYLRYKFAKAQKINAVKVKALYSGSLRLKTLSIKASNDSFSTSTTLMETITLTNQNVEDYLYFVNPTIPYESYGIENLSTYQSDIEIKELDFLGRQNGGAQSWLKAGGIQKSYTQLSQILGDTSTLRDLIASNDAVDYLVTAKAFIDDICANQTAMSLIGANDYASDILTSDAEWLNTISNSAYAELVLNVKTPTMTSNTTPKGECISGSYYSSYPNWNAFDKNTATFWASNTVAITDLNDYIGYKFVRPVSVKFFKEMARQDSGHTPLKDYDICGSNDGTNWTILYTNSNEPDIVTGVEVSHPFINNNSYLYYRLYIRSAWRGQRVGISILDFLGREIGGVQTWLRSAGIVNKNYTTVAEVLADTTTLLTLMTNDDAIDYLVTAKTFINDICADQTAMSYIGSYDYCKSTLVGDDDWCEGIVKSAYVYSVMTVNIPTMTSNTTPSGTASSSSQYSSQYPYYAFDKNSSTMAQLYGATGWVRYAFPKAVTIKAVYYGAQYADGWCNYLKASNDGTTWDTLYTFLKTVSPEYGIISSPSAYSMYEWDIQNTNQGFARLYETQLYGYEIGGVQSWLRAGGITDKAYTTIAEIASDATTLVALISSHDASDYLVTAKGLMDDICANQTIMSYIGLDNYCADTLIADDDWCVAIAMSSYKDNIFNIKAPTMTSNTTPSGVASASTTYSGLDAYKAFDGDDNTAWAGATIVAVGGDTSGFVQYEFDVAKNIRWVYIAYVYYPNIRPTAFAIKASNDGFVSDTHTLLSGTESDYVDKGIMLLNNDTAYKVYRLELTIHYYTSVGSSAASPTVGTLQLYGRADV